MSRRRRVANRGNACLLRGAGGKEQPGPALEPALHEVFVALLFDDHLGEGAKKGRHRDLTQARLAEFRAAELDQDFIVTYCMALGYSGDMKRLREHCNEAGIRKKWDLTL
jgi:hypothetical protein